MKTPNEIKKGCGIKLFPNLRDSVCCGEFQNLCPTCQALLEQAQEFQKKIENCIKKLKKEVSNAFFQRESHQEEYIFNKINRIFRDFQIKIENLEGEGNENN